MATTLNQIASLLAARVGQPFNVPLQEQIKVMVNYKRINYTQQFLTTHPEQRKFFQQSFTVDLEKVSKGDCKNIPELECSEILKSACKIPAPIRSSTTLFDFVGASDWAVGFGEITPEFNTYTKYNKYTSGLPKWVYMNEYLYIFNTLELKKVSIRGVFNNPFDVNSCCPTKSNSCFNDDSPYPVSEDILNAIMRDVLNIELRNMFPQPGIVNVPENKDTDLPVTS